MQNKKVIKRKRKRNRKRKPSVERVKSNGYITRLEQFKKVCRKYLHIKNEDYIDLLFAIYFANNFLDKIPVWLFLIGVPGSGKTIILETFADHKKIYDISTITGNTLISGMITRDGSDPSLLPELDGKILIIKDLTVLLDGRYDTAKDVFGQLRDAFDGRARKRFGTGKDDVYELKFGVVAAVTLIIDSHPGLLSDVGERFLYYRLEDIDQAEAKERALKASMVDDWKAQHTEMKYAAHHVLNLKPETIPKLSKKQQEEIVEIAHVASIARLSVRRDRSSKSIKFPAKPEVPTRLTQQLCALAQGIAIAREKTTVTSEEMRVVKKTALDCLSSNRIETLQVLLRNDSVTIKRLKEQIAGIEYGTARIRLLDLEHIGLVEDVTPKKKLEKVYRLKDEYAEILCSIWDIEACCEGDE